MNKKLMAVAVAGAFAAPAAVYAQASTVQIYGRFNVHYVYSDLGASKTTAGGATGEVRHADTLVNRASNIGFKGEERLGGGLAAWFQCESGANPLSGGGTLCSRNSALGLKGSFGNFFIGNWDTPYKRVGPIFGTAPFSTAGSFGIGNLLHNGVGGVINGGVGIAATSFTRRQTNLITYDGPVISGFKVMAAMTAANEATAQTDGSTLGKARLYSLGATYDNGPIHIAGGYERHEGFNPGGVAVTRTATGYSNSLDDDSWQINGAYTFTPMRLKVGAAWTRNNYEVNNSADMHYQAWGLYASWNIAGPHTLRFGYTKAQDTKGGAGTLAVPIIVGQAVANGNAGNTGAELIALRYAYAMSKRTEVNAGIVFLDNDPNARYELNNPGGVGTGAGFQTGFQQRAIVLGAKHSF